MCTYRQRIILTIQIRIQFMEFTCTACSQDIFFSAFIKLIFILFIYVQQIMLGFYLPFKCFLFTFLCSFLYKMFCYVSIWLPLLTFTISFWKDAQCFFFIQLIYFKIVLNIYLTFKEFVNVLFLTFFRLKVEDSNMFCLTVHGNKEMICTDPVYRQICEVSMCARDT